MIFMKWRGQFLKKMLDSTRLSICPYAYVQSLPGIEHIESCGVSLPALISPAQDCGGACKTYTKKPKQKSDQKQQQKTTTNIMCKRLLSKELSDKTTTQQGTQVRKKPRLWPLVATESPMEFAGAHWPRAETPLALTCGCLWRSRAIARLCHRGELLCDCAPFYCWACRDHRHLGL